MKTELIEKAYAIARERYAEIGVDTEKALAALQNISLSLHCWQADDVTGFENRGGDLTGGIQATGNYPGKARNIGELRADILKAKSFIPGTHRLNLHEIYGEFGGETVDRDQVEPRHFQGWIEWAKEHGMKLDFNSTSFSHPKSGDLSLANPDPGIRDFWVEHTKRCRAIAEEMGKAQGDPSIMNLWVHDGSKDLTVNRMLYRELLRDSLDRIFETEYDHMKDSIESKVFGIGLESYTVGSNDFYIGYGASRGKIVTLDTGHFHPTEIVADKISSLLLFIPEVMLHVSRPVRWDSDHVTIMNDDTLELCKEIDRTLRCARPRSYRAGLFRCLDQPHRRLCHRFARHAEVPDAGVARTARAASPVRGCRTGLRAPGATRRVEVAALERRMGHVLPAQRRARGRGVHRRDPAVRKGSNLQTLRPCTASY